MTTDSVYPVSVEGELSENLSRWLWLIKWILIIPHIIVLFFLWIVFFILSIIAFFAILITARYPVGIFNFNVGVMRWTWRVSYYSYGALGTDRYPPFSLSTRDYPANLEVEYPEQLSRVKVLFKWWLLAIPHYIVVSFFSGGGGLRGGGLTTVLAIFAAVVVLFKNYYPRDMFYLVMGMNRWSIRVLAYVALMRDEYPPFRLDP